MMRTASGLKYRNTARSLPALSKRCNPEAKLGLLILAMMVWAAGFLRAEGINEARQLIVGIAEGWDSNHGKIQRFERSGDSWKPVGDSIEVLFGRSGLAWGRGERGQNEAGRQKAEKDWRAPAGLFRIGTIYTYDRQLPEGSNYPFHTVGESDAWIDDVTHPQYNQHVTVDLKNPPSWYAKERMRLGDFAYHWLVEIRHNADPAIPGHGSAIFFHIRRGPNKPSAGCTTMAEANLVTLIRWLRADAHPYYALLPKPEYERLWKSWGLPPDALLK
jgi:L,D-peptidoglycan transpeptidase YkuD (ErfK/YbiS/YcfS/YnhG family)